MELSLAQSPRKSLGERLVHDVSKQTSTASTIVTRAHQQQVLLRHRGIEMSEPTQQNVPTTAASTAPVEAKVVKPKPPNPVFRAMGMYLFISRSTINLTSQEYRIYLKNCREEIG